MKFALKSLVAAAAFVAVGAASAAPIVVPVGPTSLIQSAEGTLTYSQVLAGALNLGQVQMGAFGGATTSARGKHTVYTAVGGGFDNPETSANEGATSALTTYNTWQTTAGVQSLAYDPLNAGKVTRVLSTGGAAQTMAANEELLQAAGGQGQVGNLDVQFQANGDVHIYGTITGQSNNGTTVNYSGKIFTVLASNITGATSFNNEEGTFYTTLNNLAITAEGFDALADAFGLAEGGLGYSSLQGAASNFGSLTSKITVAVVPEPSTYALMGVGLVGVGLMARRRRAA